MNEPRRIPLVPRLFRCNLRDGVLSAEELIRCAGEHGRGLAWVTELTVIGLDDPRYVIFPGERAAGPLVGKISS